MQTSAQGVAALEAEEGVVLRAYRCPAGVWTIGAGLTAASGVVRPRAGMVITRIEATNLLQMALRRRYEPDVKRALSAEHLLSPRQHQFDAAVSFHFNTGAIGRASWVRNWGRGAPAALVAAGLLKWVRGGGRVLPGLLARRQREAAMWERGVYPEAPASPRQPVPALPGSPAGDRPASWAVLITQDEAARVEHGLRRLGYRGLSFAEVARFQADHGLTVDGIIGRATLSTLQRRLDAPKASAKPAVAASVALPASNLGSSHAQGLGVPGAEWIALGLVAVWGLSVAWRYRDVLAAKVAHTLPRIANLLRSF